MDISVSRLNQRMALQLPAEFPLGLVFVVGRVEDLTAGTGNGERAQFQLSHREHYLRCQLSARAATEARFAEGDLVRAGGHLSFESTQAAYYLLARDIEILEESTQKRSALSEIIADTRQRSPATNVPLSEMPAWVRRMAPPQIRADLEQEGIAINDSAATFEGEWDGLSGEADLAYPSEEPALAGLTDELIAFLSEAIDSPDEFEITSELLSTLSPNTPVQEEYTPSVSAMAAMAYEPVVEESGSRLESSSISDDSATSAKNVANGNEELVPWYLVLVVLFIFLSFLVLISVAIMYR